MPSMPSPSPYWPAIASADPDGTVVVDRLAMQFFLEPHSCLDPYPVIGAIKLFLAVFVQDVAHSYVDDEGNAHSLGRDPDRILQQRIAIPTLQRNLVEFSLVETDASPYRDYVGYFFDAEEVGDAKPERRVSLTFRVPQAELVRVGPRAVVDFMLSLSDVLPYTYGYANPALTCEYSFDAALPHIRRYPGLDVAIASSVAHDIGDGPLGAYWINVFGPRLAAQLGSPAELVSRLPEGAKVSPGGQGGLCVVLGEVPDIGDIDRQDDLPSYRQLAAILRPWLGVPRVTYFTDGRGMAARDAQVAWHRRFLEP